LTVIAHLSGTSMAGAADPAVPRLLPPRLVRDDPALVVPSFFGNAFFVFLIRQYIRTLPRELESAAAVDGCNQFQIFWYIVLPLCRPVLAVCVVFVFLATWNDLLGPLIYLVNDEDYTVAIGLANMTSRANPQ
jgi:multiple sugar transport system permease protein